MKRWKTQNWESQENPSIRLELNKAHHTIHSVRKERLAFSVSESTKPAMLEHLLRIKLRPTCYKLQSSTKICNFWSSLQQCSSWGCGGLILFKKLKQKHEHLWNSPCFLSSFALRHASCSCEVPFAFATFPIIVNRTHFGHEQPFNSSMLRN